MNYCWERFESAHSMPNSYGLNIRIVKFKKEDLIDKNFLYRYFITPGFSESAENIPRLNIAFCPFCGENLFAFYKSDVFVNAESKHF